MTPAKGLPDGPDAPRGARHAGCLTHGRRRGRPSDGVRFPDPGPTTPKKTRFASPITGSSKT